MARVAIVRLRSPWCNGSPPPGVEINKLFRLVRDDVMEATAGRQEPFTYGSLPGREDFFFVQR
jgi:hypothetical protein